MRAIGRILVPLTFSLYLVACGGNGNGKPQQVQIPDPPAAPVVTVGADIKQLIFSWDTVAGATHYRLLENPDGHSGFAQVGDNIPSAELSVARDIAVHQHDWVRALYLVQACNASGCKGSTQVSVTDLMVDTVGYFKASNTELSDHFGRAVALSGDGKTLAVGAPPEDSSAIGINGDQTDNSNRYAGAVYVFRFDGVAWHQQAYVKASNTDPFDDFGNSIALSRDGNTMVVGAYTETSGATGIDGDQADNTSIQSGAVYLYGFDDNSWRQQAYIKASNTGQGDHFGWSLALSPDGDLLAVGAPGEGSAAAGINGDQTDNSLDSAGAVYLFYSDGFTWTQQAYIKASNTGFGDKFGEAVALSADGQTLAVGALFENSIAAGINGDQYDDIALKTFGAVYLFRFDDTNWYQQAYIKASNTKATTPGPGDRFGDSIALSADGNTLAVGATEEDSSATGLNGDQYDDVYNGDFGAVYMFRFDGVDWYQQAYIKSSNSGEGDYFGNVALSADGNTLAVGASGEDSIATGINGDEYDDHEIGASGAVYVFQFDGADWYQQAYVKASNPGNGVPNPDCEPQNSEYCRSFGDLFGSSVALCADGKTLAVGAHYEDSSVTGINGDQTDNSADNSGAVYVY